MFVPLELVDWLLIDNEIYPWIMENVGWRRFEFTELVGGHLKGVWMDNEDALAMKLKFKL